MNQKILIVEDEILIALEIEDIVRDAGFDVGAIAADRDAALAAADDCAIALVDLNLRDGPTGPSIGMDLASRGIRVIYLTANPAQIGAAAIAAIGVITKPFRAQSIRATVQLAANDQMDPTLADIAGFTPFRSPYAASHDAVSTH